MAERTFDADAAHAARAEQLGETPVLRFGGEEYALPAEVEYDIAVQIAGLPFKEAVQLILGDEQFERFWAHKPTAADVLAIDEWMGELWKTGESPASGTP